MGDLDTFVDARETMIPRIGLQSYADVMSAFAGSERLINRAWSASADGYADEALDFLDKTEEQFVEAKAQFDSLTGQEAW